MISTLNPRGFMMTVLVRKEFPIPIPRDEIRYGNVRQLPALTCQRWSSDDNVCVHSIGSLW
jgi:hypothetical protein